MSAPNITNGTAWSASTGGTQYTDLILPGGGVTAVRTDVDGMVSAFQGPDGIQSLWVDFGTGSRFCLRTIDSPASTFVGLGKVGLDVKNYGAVGNGSTDDAAAITAALAAGYDVYLSGQAGDVYILGSTITVPANKVLRAAPGVTLKAIPGLNAAMILLGGDGATLRDISIDGNRANITAGIAVVISNGPTQTGNIVRNVKIRNAKGDSIRGAGPLNDLSIVDNDIASGDGSGINLIGGGARITIARNRVQSVNAVTAGPAIQVYAVSPAYTDVIVSENIVTNLGASGIPIEVQWTTRASIVGNVISGTGVRGISLGQLIDSAITGNSISNQTTYGMEANVLTRCVISGNVIRSCQSGIGGQACVDLTIIGNLIHTTDPTYSNSHGIWIQTAPSKRILIRGNHFVDIAAYGVRIYSGTPEDIVVDSNTYTITSAATFYADAGLVTVDAWVRGAITNNVCHVNLVDAYSTEGIIDIGAVATDLVIARNTLRSTSGGVLAKRAVAVRAAATGLRVEHNLIKGYATGIHTATAAADAQILNNRVVNCTTAYTTAAGQPVFGSRMEVEATAAPTTGTWVLGDRCVNSAPAVGSAKGWTCTVAGTPGTWVSTGNL